MTLQLKNLPPLHPLAIEEIEEILSLLKSGRLAYSEYEHGPDGLSHSLAGWKLIKDAGRIRLEYENYDGYRADLTYKSRRKVEKKLFKTEPFRSWGASEYAMACWGITRSEALLLLGEPLDTIIHNFERIKEQRIH